ncbi:MAG: MBL fold metallo-hydrolase [Acidobacteria bacterium]|nr:MAG: MBL fold metallo-hydrolase [Acidobacteriota bacterium]REK02977.1 MAG: MBL fold metallo-hydrolase [Acidobacteriota bacterium]REK13219.1 MAG: MBL fold metallo-hydrolase [Acidobacteriota bacterium]REK41213.1 MAG: MBL fold metallo-hydrolase [Acidobacteriota bacterium]
MRFTVLGSGSTGNSVLITTENTRVLVDAGLSAKQILLRLAEVGEDFEKLDGILITHEHTDHAGGLRVLLNTVRCPVYISDKTKDSYLRPKNGANGEKETRLRKNALKDTSESIESDHGFSIGDIDFEPFSVPHDAADNFGFVANNRGVRLATLMDFGHFTPLMKEKLKGCDAIVVESNHSIEMLRMCSIYSWELKQRISSDTGHISNEDLARWLSEDYDGSARDIVLAHLSQKSNEPNLAKLSAEYALDSREPLFRSDTKITLSRHDAPTPWLDYS